MGKLHVVVGGQYGSEGKGAVTGALAKKLDQMDRNVTVVRVAGPNAGHSAVGCFDGKLWAMRQVPVAAVTNPRADLLIAAGSEIDPEVLFGEVRELDEAGYRVSDRLIVDSSATVITQRHKDIEYVEALTDKVGSTGKGIGAARAHRAMRTAQTWGEWLETEGPDQGAGFAMADTSRYLNRLLVAVDVDVIIEGTQGYGLGLHGRHYPQCTSSDCRAIDFMAMAGVNPWRCQVDVWVVLRCYPIRVAGNSGPLQGETSWEALGLPEERTTVTRKVRRVGEWDRRLAFEAVQANGAAAVKVALTMLDQAVPEIAGISDAEALQGTADEVERVKIELAAWFERVEETGATLGYVGTGPDTGVWHPGHDEA